MFCPQCGARVPDQGSYCPKCGIRLDQSQQGGTRASGLLTTPARTTVTASGLSLVVKVLMVVEGALAALLVIGVLVRLLDKGDSITDRISLYESLSATFGAILFFLLSAATILLLAELASVAIGIIARPAEKAGKRRNLMISSGLTILIVCLFVGALGDEFLGDIFSSSSDEAGPAFVVLSFFFGWIEDQMGLLLVVGVIPLVTAALTGQIGKKVS